jgi:hypothetical protein
MVVGGCARAFVPRRRSIAEYKASPARCLCRGDAVGFCTIGSCRSTHPNRHPRPTLRAHASIRPSLLVSSTRAHRPGNVALILFVHRDTGRRENRHTQALNSRQPWRALVSRPWPAVPLFVPRRTPASPRSLRHPCLSHHRGPPRPVTRLTRSPAPPALKPPVRPSLRSIGIPDGRDVLAVFIWWLNQQQLRAFIASQMSSEIASSIRSVHGDDEEWHETALSSLETSAFETRSTAFDLCGVGGQFE